MVGLGGPSFRGGVGGVGGEVTWRYGLPGGVILSPDPLDPGPPARGNVGRNAPTPSPHTCFVIYWPTSGSDVLCNFQGVAWVVPREANKLHCKSVFFLRKCIEQNSM